MAFVRFVIADVDEDSGQRTGLFQALFTLSRDGNLLPHQEQQWKEVRVWFDQNLDEPARLSKSSRPHAQAKAISWFKDTAVEHIQRMRMLAEILREHDIVCEVVQTQRPGYIVFEDEYQVAAEPFRDTQT
jgi:hypothetical protein